VIRPGQAYGPLGLFRDRRLEAVSGTRIAAWTFSLVALAALLAIAGFLVAESLPLWAGRGARALADTQWSAPHERYGALSMVFGTLAVAAIAMLLAGPLGVLGAVHLSELLPARARPACKVIVDLLAGVPSVVYGLIGIALVRGPVEALGLASGDSLLTAGLVLAVMILPTVLSLSDEALRAVGRPYRDACRALGLTDAETVLHGVLGPALPGVVAALLLALGRALGETVAVFLLVGRADGRFPASLSPASVLAALRAPGQTLTSKLGGPEPFLAHADPVHWAAICSLGLVLFAVTSALTLAGQRLVPGEARRE
jgi:phosphate ABC transporter permease protein PstC